MVDDETEMKEKEARAVFVSDQLADKNTVWGTVTMPNNYLSDTQALSLFFSGSLLLYFPHQLAFLVFPLCLFFLFLK